MKPDGYVDTEHLNEATSLLPQTCDMFIKTLDEAMRLSDANFVYTLSTERVGDSAILHHHHVGSTSRKVRTFNSTFSRLYTKDLCGSGILTAVGR